VALAITWPTVKTRRGTSDSSRRRSASLFKLVALAIAIGVASPLPRAFGQRPSPAAAQPIPHGQDAAPNAPRSPDEAVKAMSVPPGFTVEVVAAEPDIVNPVAMTFDERGRVWITESLEYPRRSAGPGRDRVKVLEDSDGDGRADRFTVFADGLNIPSGIAVGHGGVWVANSPDILFLQDRDGDGKADSREIVATGFGRHDTHELPNSLTWGPDGWLYGWNGVFNPGKVVSKNGKTYSFTCAIFRIHPTTRVFEIWCEGTSNPWGIAIDAEGSFFSSACVIDHLWHLVETGYYIRQGGPYPPFTWPIESIVGHEHQKAAYCGIHYFDSASYPPEYRGKLFMGNIHGNAINVDAIEQNGSTYRATSQSDFLQANDAWFMPVVQKTGPDGSLYVLDWYDRYHCYQDANRDPAGIDRLKGRLYRVRYKTTPRRFGFDLAKFNEDELFKLLGSANVFDRDIAQRLLTERKSAEINSRLQSLVLNNSVPRVARMHALWAVIGSGPIESGFHRDLLRHDDPSFRAWGVRAAGNQRKIESSIKEIILKLTTDNPEVRLQLAIAARKIEGLDALSLLLDVEQKSSLDPLIPRIVWQNLLPMIEERSDELARRLTARKGKAPGLSLLIPRTIERLLECRDIDAAVVAKLLFACSNQDSTLEALDLLLERFRDHSLPRPLEDALRVELKRVLKSMFGPRDDFDEFLTVAQAYCGDQQSLKRALAWARSSGPGNGRGGRKAREELRIRALQAILYRQVQGTARTLIAGILAEDDSLSSTEFRGKVIEALSKADDPDVAAAVLKAYPALPLELKSRAVNLLTHRPAWTKALLDAIASKQLPKSVLNVTQLRKLQQSRDPTTLDTVRALWGTIRDRRDPSRESVADRIRDLVRKTPGDPVAGHAVFKRVCALCHKIYGEGQEVGPDLTSNGRNDFDQLISNVFDPSLVIGPGYQATTLATVEGRILSGLLVEDGNERVLLKLQGAQVETIQRSQIEQIKTSELSLMPDSFDTQLAPQEIADLCAFLCLDKPPSDPTAKALPGSGPMMQPARRPESQAP
jgi:putative membrane-bound dehydrogenase-like protein